MSGELHAYDWGSSRCKPGALQKEGPLVKYESSALSCQNESICGGDAAAWHVLNLSADLAIEYMRLVGHPSECSYDATWYTALGEVVFDMVRHAYACSNAS